MSSFFRARLKAVLKEGQRVTSEKKWFHQKELKSGIKKKLFTCRDKLIQSTRIDENDHFIEVYSGKCKLQSNLLCHRLSVARQSLRIYPSRWQWLCVQRERNIFLITLGAAGGISLACFSNIGRKNQKQMKLIC